LIDPPRINTTRMIANSSTTDSEMATTDHTLRSVRSPGPEVQPHTPPPGPSCHQPGSHMRRVTHRRPRACGPDPPVPPRDGPTAVPRTAIRACTPTVNSEGPLPCPHILFAGNSNCCHRHIKDAADGSLKANEPDISPESPASLMHHLVRMNEDRTSPDSKLIGIRIPLRTDRPTSMNPGYSQAISRNDVESFTKTHRQR
jgi:hypothetical protein